MPEDVFDPGRAKRLGRIKKRVRHDSGAAGIGRATLTRTLFSRSFTGISPTQSQALVEKAHIYLTANGRISMAGLNSHNIRYFAESLDKVVRGQL